MDPIHLFVPKFRVEECLAEIKECLEKGWTGLGYKTVAFEEAWKQYTGLPHAHFLNSATAGLHLALEILKRDRGWPAGKEVITTPLTFVSTNHAIVHAGLLPVFVDVDDYLCLDPDRIEKAITANTRAVVFVGMGGNTGQLARVSALCRERGLALILDAAHMAGTRIGNCDRSRHVGQEADVAVFSFQAVKNLPTSDSGMICFREEQHDVTARKLSWLGINKDTYSRTVSSAAYKWRYEVETVGYKYHGNSIAAALGLVGLRYLDQDNASRRALADAYDRLLVGDRYVGRVPMAPDCLPSRHLYQIRVGARDELMLHLNERQIFPGVHYQDNRCHAPYLQCEHIGSKAHDASEELVSLPLHLNMTLDDVARVAEAVREFAA